MTIRHATTGRWVATFAVVAATVIGGGCGKRPPQFVEVSGVLLIDGKPLPKAKIEFQPELANFGAEMNSWAVTDDEGRFTLARNFTQEPGAAVGKHRVIVSELPTPGEFRSQDPAVQAKYAQYKASLKNRPVPVGYSQPATTPIEVEIKPEQHDYKIELKRG
jgi:hypothetical protein